MKNQTDRKDLHDGPLSVVRQRRVLRGFALVSATFIVPLVAAATEEINSAQQYWEMWVHPLLHIVAAIIGFVGALVMLWGFIQAVWSFIGTELRGGHAQERAALRTGLSYYILFGLELLIVADVIETITAPEFKHVLVLGLIVVIRTVISFGLNWEMAQEAKHRRTPSNEKKKLGRPA